MTILLAGAICLLATVPALAIKYNEAPMLKVKVAAGELPPVEERLPEEPIVVKPVEEIGQYGGEAYVCRQSRWQWNNAAHLIGYEHLLRIGTDYKTVVPNLAKGWKFSEDKKDITIYLRKGIKWSDGAPFTADDIMFWYEDVLLNKELTPVFPKTFSPGGKPMVVEKIDDYTVTLHFAMPYPVILSSMLPMQDFFLPAHYLKQFHIKYNPKADELAKKEEFDSWYQLFQMKKSANWRGQPLENPDLPTLCSFYLKKLSSDIGVFERNPYYFKVDPAGNQLPYIDKIVVKNLSAKDVAKTKSITGDFDFSDAIAIEDYPLCKKNETKGNYRVLLWNTATGSHRVYQLNLTYKKDLVLRDIFRDVRFRRALSLAINREEINETFFFGLGVPRQMTVIPDSKYFEPEFAKAYAEYNPKEANRLLDEMGLKWDKNHEYRLRPDGKKLSWTFLFCIPTDKVTELVIEYWKKIGVEVTIKPGAFSLFFERNLGNLSPMTGWGGPFCTDVLFPTTREWFVPGHTSTSTWCPLWAQWYETGGKEGEEPPQEIKNLFTWFEKLQTTLDVEWGKKILRSQAENIWTIGIVMAPRPLLVRTNLRNIPETGNFNVSGEWTAYTHPEQYFFKQK